MKYRLSRSDQSWKPDVMPSVVFSSESQVCHLNVSLRVHTSPCGPCCNRLSTTQSLSFLPKRTSVWWGWSQIWQSVVHSVPVPTPGSDHIYGSGKWGLRRRRMETLGKFLLFLVKKKDASWWLLFLSPPLVVTARAAAASWDHEEKDKRIPMRSPTLGYHRALEPTLVHITCNIPKPGKKPSPLCF